MTTMRKASTFATAALGILVAASVANAALTELGPVNRLTPFAPAGAPFITHPSEFDPTAPIGYPLYFQDASGLRLTFAFPPQGISAAPNPAIPGSMELNTGGEIFYWHAAADVVLSATAEVALEYAVEGTFGGTEAIIDGQQIAFTRVRISVSTNVAGDYVVDHPYGTDTVTVVPDNQGRIRGEVLTVDIGGASLTNPDGAFIDVLSPLSVIGPNFLTWTSFNPDPALNNPALQAPNPNNPSQPFQFVGLVTALSTVKGGRFRDVVTVTPPVPLAPRTQNLWTVTGKVFSSPVPVLPAGHHAVAPANLLLLN